MEEPLERAVIRRREGGRKGKRGEEEWERQGQQRWKEIQDIKLKRGNNRQVRRGKERKGQAVHTGNCVCVGGRGRAVQAVGLPSSPGLTHFTLANSRSQSTLGGHRVDDQYAESL